MSSKKPKRPRDPNQLAKLVVDIASGEEKEFEGTVLQKRAAKGGEGRKKALTPKQRSDIARVAAQARWKKKD